jgi:iron complex transport system substrate-binding protein
LCAAENVFASHGGYKALSSEAIAAAEPEAIGMMDHTLQSMGGVAGVANHPALRFSPAAKQTRIVARDGSFLLGFGPRLPEAILDFARAIRGKDQS